MASKQPEQFVSGQARILSNTSYLLAASIIQKFISLGYFVYYARVLGPAGTGLFEPIRTVIPIALVIIDFSLSTVLTREIARSPDRSLEYVNNVLSVKILLALLALIVTLGVNALVNFDQVTRSLLFFAGVVVAFDMFTVTFTAALRGIQVFRYEAIGIVLTQVISAVTGIVAFKLHAGVTGLMFAFVGGSIVNFWFMLAMFRRRIGSFPRLSWNYKIVSRFVAIALPILGAALLAKLFTYADRYLLLHTHEKAAVGIYVAAHRAPFALEFIAAAFAASLLPAMSRFFVHARDQLGRVMEQSFRYLLIISVPIFIGMFVLAHPLIVKLFGRAYLDAVTPLRIMISALPLIFLNFPVGSFLIATNRQVWNTINLGAAVVVNILSNLILQPSLGPIGAAISVVISYLVLFILGIIQVRRVIRFNTRILLTVVLHTFVAASIMALPLALLQRTFSPYFLIIPGAALYGAALFMLRTITTDDLKLLLRALGKNDR